MQKHFYTFAFLILANAVLAQMTTNCNAPAPKMLIAGDSWAQYMADDGTHNKVLKIYGQADKTALAETFEIGILCTDSNPDAGDYAVSGSLAVEWADEANYLYTQALVSAVIANPSVTHILLSIGGNDILAGRSEGGWYKDMDLDVPNSEQILFTRVLNDMTHIMNRVWNDGRDDIQFIISGYDYPNFNISGLYCGFYACPKREDLSRDSNGNGEIDPAELITDAELNAMMTSVEQIRKDFADSDTRVFYDNGQGLMHHFYGYDDGVYASIPEGTTVLPGGTTPYAPGGNPGTPTDLDNFRTVDVCGIGWFPADPIHLDAEAYEYKIKNQFDNIFFEQYRGTPDATFYSESAKDGYLDIIDNTVNVNGLRMGDDGWDFPGTAATNDYRSILSFNTAGLPDNANVTGASVYLIRSGADDNPFEKNGYVPRLDIKNGHFGTSENLEPADGTDAADAEDVGCFQGIVEEDKFALRVDLSAAALAHFNKTGTTQMRLQFGAPDWSTEYVNFYDGGGNPGYLPPEVIALQNPPIYEYQIIKTEFAGDGDTTQIVLERGPQIERREGYAYKEKLRKAEENEAGDLISTYAVVATIEHPVLARYMSQNHGAPGNGYAPFLDVQYELVLPAELAYFSAEKRGKAAVLNWQTVQEINVDFFTVERSFDKINWEKIGDTAATGNSAERVDYQMLDHTPQSGKNYYRLTTTDRDGSVAYSEIRSVNFSAAGDILTVYPNPTRAAFSVQFGLENAGNIDLQIYDIFGKNVFTKSITAAAGAQNYTLTDTQNLPKGMYVIRAIIDGKMQTVKAEKF